MYKTELETALDLAKKASTIILNYYSQDVVTEFKIGKNDSTEPVTIADKASSRLIVDGLAAAFPQDAILSEEEIDQPEKRIKSRRTWIIDPIDGTWGFVKKDGDFAVQIGLVENGEPVVGIVLAPALGYAYYASKNDGAFIQHKDGEAERLFVSNETDLSKMTVAASRNHSSQRSEFVTQQLGFKDVVRRGSVGIKTGLICERKCDVYFNLSQMSKFWDTCAPQAILTEAGGIVTDLFGIPLKYDIADVQNHNGMIATNASAHKKVVTMLKPMLAKFGRLRVIPR